MQKKLIKLFSNTIHEVKQVITEIAQEREKYHENITKLRKEQKTMRKKHDKAVKKQIKELLGVVGELYELFDDLSNDKEYCKCKKPAKVYGYKNTYCSCCGKLLKIGDK